MKPLRVACDGNKWCRMVIQLLDLGRNFSARMIAAFLHPLVCRGRIGAFDVSCRASDRDDR